MNNPQPFGSLFAPSSAAPTLGQTSNASAKPFGLFGTSATSNANNTQPFGSLAAAPPLGQASTAASKPFSWGLGNSTANNTTTSQPFSSLSAAPALGQTSTAASNPFGWSLGNSTANNATTSQTFGTNMIGPQSQQQPQNPQSTSEPQQQDGQQPQTIAKDSAPAYFNTLLEKGRKRAHGSDESPAFGDLPSLQLGLSDIVKRARELGDVTGQPQGPTGTGTGTDSRAHYLLAASGVNSKNTRRNLNSLNAQSSASNLQQPVDWDPDNSKYINQLQQQSTLKMIEEGIARAHRNFDAYLEESIDINWEAQRRKIQDHFGLLPKGTDTNDFGDSTGRGSFGRSTRRGRGLKNDWSGQATGSRSIFGKSGMQKSVIGTPSVGPGNASIFVDVAEKSSAAPVVQDERFIRERQNKYAEKVQRLNGAQLQETSYPVLQEFWAVENQPTADSPSQLRDAYKALTEITQESANNVDAVKPRQFAEDYLDEAPNSVKAMNVRRRILDGSRKTLEKQFWDHLDSFVERNPREADLGGVPTILNRVRGYVRIRANRKDLTPEGVELQVIGDDYCWALVFFLLRCGLVREAAEYVTSNATPFKSMDRNFVTYVTAYASSLDRRLPRSTQDRINAEYQQRTRIAPENTLDPYRMACYKIIGRCELSKRSIDFIVQGVEDWIWLQFSLAREVNRVEEVASEVYGLEEVRDTIREIGDRHFSHGAEGLGGWGTYFFLQILGGMFEQAVAYLYTYSYVSAVHFAIALDYYGLLRVSDLSVSDSELLTRNTKELPQISFGRMIGYYTRDFRSSNVEAAVDYLALICLNADLPGALGRSQVSLCHEALRELVLETREFAQLLGDIRSDGTRICGAIEQRLPIIGIADQEDFLRTVTIQAASVADDNGRTTDAVLLYHLAEDYDNVVVIINRALSEALAVDIGQEQMRLQPLKPRAPQQQGQNQEQQKPGSSLSLTSVDDPAVLSRNMISLYDSNAMYYQKVRATNRDACGLLLRMSEVKERVTTGRWIEALDLITSLHLLPLSAYGSTATIRSSAQAFNSLPATISRNVGPLLLWTITCIGKQREILQSSEFEDQTRKQMSAELLASAKDLMVFAGAVRARLGERIWESLVRCGGEVGPY